jgi:Predicted dehydrogenases and related proteins
MDNLTRRALLKTTAGLAAGLTAASIFPSSLSAAVHTLRRGRVAPRIKFGVIGLNHGHINGQVDTTTKGGGELVSFYAKEPDLRDAFAKRYPNAKVAKDEREVLEDPTIQLILSASIPSERAPLGVRVMKAGKDFMSDKPGITSLEQLAEVRRVQAETKRIYSILYSEHFEVGAAVKAGDLVKAGAIGQVIQTIGLGPHRINPPVRPEWFWDTKNYGGIICDLASHQFEQFLFFTGSTSAEIVSSQVRNVRHKDHPKFEDFGDVMIRGNGGTGYIRVDWFTPGGPAHLGRRTHDHPRHRRLHRAAEVRRHRRRDARRRSSLPRRREGCAEDRLQERREAVRSPVGGRRREPHRDGDAAGALLPGGGDVDQGAECGEAPGHLIFGRFLVWSCSLVIANLANPRTIFANSATPPHTGGVALSFASERRIFRRRHAVEAQVGHRLSKCPWKVVEQLHERASAGDLVAELHDVVVE